MAFFAEAESSVFAAAALKTEIKEQVYEAVEAADILLPSDF